jgi:catechol 2,3-dioxygenase-like lactoylglutathione lyase family enzyme
MRLYSKSWGAVLSMVLAVGASAMVHAAGESPMVFAVKVPTTDIARSVTFYTRLAGMVEGPQYNAHEKGLLPAQSGAGSQVILFDVGHSENRRFKDVKSWFIISVADIQAVVKRFQDAGVTKMDKPVAAGGAVLLFTEDPDGNVVEFMQLPAAK